MFEELLNLQHTLVEAQLDVNTALNRKETSGIKEIEIDIEPKLEEIPGGYKIIVYEFPPKTSIHSKITFKNGRISRETYRKTRDHWYSIIRKAVKGERINQVVPAFIYISYFVPHLCDLDNFVEKFIIDGLMYANVTGKDDNLNFVPLIVKDAYIDNKFPRTEIHILRDKEQLRKTLFND